MFLMMPPRSLENEALKDLLWKIYREAPHANECRFLKIYPTGPEQDLCDCFRADIARWLRVWKPRSF